MAPLAGMVMRGPGPHLQQRALGSEKVCGLPDPDHVDHVPIRIMPSSQLCVPLSRFAAGSGSAGDHRIAIVFTAREHHPNARQMVWQMAKVAFGCRTPGFVIGVAFGHRFPGGLGLGDSRFQIFECQLAIKGGQA
jgi:hypothetical protein